MIIFIPHEIQYGGYYVNLQHAEVVQKGGYGRIEFELTPGEIAALESEDPETPVWGDEADLVFSRVHAGWQSGIAGGARPISEDQLPSTAYPWRYWCAVDENWNVVEQW